MLLLVVGCPAVLSAASAKEAARRCSGAPLPSGAMLEAQLTRTGGASFICALGKHKFCLGAKRVGHIKPSLLRCRGLEGKSREGGSSVYLSPGFGWASCVLCTAGLSAGGWSGLEGLCMHMALCWADIWRLCTLRKDYSALPA